MNQNTQVVVIFPIMTTEWVMKDRLRAFSLAGMFKVAVLVPANSTNPCRLLFHMPFARTEADAFVSIENPKELSAGYPNKLSNLNGFEFNLQYSLKSPHVMMTNGRLGGINMCLFDLLFKRWNASYRTTELSGSFLEQNFTTDQFSDLFINKMPFLDLSLLYLFDCVIAPDVEQYRVMIRNLPLDNIWSYMRIYFLYDYTVVIWISFTLIAFVYFCLFKAVPWRTFILDFHYLFPIFFLLPSHMRISSFKEKLFLSFVFSFVFFAMSGFICNLTSQIVAYYPMDKIQSLEELEHRGIPIYTDYYIKTFLNAGKYSMTKQFLNRLNVSALSPWESSGNAQDLIAYVINMHTSQFYIYSALNRDVSGQSKYYLLDTSIATIPLIYMFPVHSPYQDDFNRVVKWMEQSGIKKFWETKVLSQTEWADFHSFRDEDPVVYQTTLKLHHLNFNMIILFIGEATGLVVFLFEIMWAKIHAVWLTIKRI